MNTHSQDVALRMLEGSWKAAREALIFNFLSDRAAPTARGYGGTLRRHDAFKLLGWALSKTSQVAFRQDYFPLGHDATILMRR